MISLISLFLLFLPSSSADTRSQWVSIEMSALKAAASGDFAESVEAFKLKEVRELRAKTGLSIDFVCEGTPPKTILSNTVSNGNKRDKKLIAALLKSGADPTLPIPQASWKPLRNFKTLSARPEAQAVIEKGGTLLRNPASGKYYFSSSAEAVFELETPPTGDSPQALLASLKAGAPFRARLLSDIPIEDENSLSALQLARKEKERVVNRIAREKKIGSDIEEKHPELKERGAYKELKTRTKVHALKEGIKAFEKNWLNAKDAIENLENEKDELEKIIALMNQPPSEGVEKRFLNFRMVQEGIQMERVFEVPVIEDEVRFIPALGSGEGK